MLNTHIWGKSFKNKSGEDTYYPLICHMLDTVTAAEILFKNWLSPNLRRYLSNQFGDDGQALKFVKLAAGLHDIGKCTPIFQHGLLNPRGRQHQFQAELLRDSGMSFPELDYSVASKRYEKLHRHEKLGYWLLSGGERDTSSGIGESWLKSCILSHHGSYEISYGTARSSQQSFLSEMITKDWIEQSSIHKSLVETACGVTYENASSLNISHESVILISGLIILSDRIASNELSVLNSCELQSNGQLNPLQSIEYCDNRFSFLTNLVKSEIGFSSKIDVKSILGNFEPRGVQNLVPTLKSGLWAVMAPTGAGKTEAALMRHAQEKENLIFLLPTKSTTDAMMSRMQRIYTDDTTVATLAHGDAYLNDFYSEQKNTELDGECGSGLIPAKMTKYGAKLAAPVTVATIDQMVIAGIPLKWSHLRLLTLANAHIVIDEAHLLDAYQITLINEILTLLGNVGTKVTVLSATMTQKLKQEFAQNYLGDDSIEVTASFPSEEFFEKEAQRGESAFEVDSYQIDVSLTPVSDLVDAHVEWAENILRESPDARLGIFVNTVDRCQKIAEELDNRIHDAEVICLHSRMLGRHRKQVVDRLLAECGTQGGKAKRIILVGTQVIEMSLDIDLDLISTDICPAPSFIQRAGRMWRDKGNTAMSERYTRISEMHKNMQVQVFSPDLSEVENKKSLYLPYNGQLIGRTLDFIEKVRILDFPKDIQNFVETSTISMDMIDENEVDFEEISQEMFKRMSAGSLKINILEFLSPWASVSDAAVLTNFDTSEDSAATRLIEGEYPPLIILSSDSFLQELGALSPTSNPKELHDIILKSASVGVGWKHAKVLTDQESIPLKIGKNIFGYFCQLPTGLIYHKKYGLMTV